MNTVPLPAASGVVAKAFGHTDLYNNDPNTFPQAGPPTVGPVSYFHGLTARCAATGATLEFYDGLDDTGHLIGTYVIATGGTVNDAMPIGHKIGTAIYVKYIAGAGNVTAGAVRIG